MANVVQKIDLDPQMETQSVDLPIRRTIYDAGTNEIAWKSFVAGFSMGLGRMIANLIFFTIVAGFFVAFVQPWLDGYMQPLYDALENPGAAVTPSWLENGLNSGSAPWFNSAPAATPPSSLPTQTR